MILKIKVIEHAKNLCWLGKDKRMKRFKRILLYLLILGLVIPNQIVDAKEQDTVLEELTENQYVEVEDFKNYETVSALYMVDDKGNEIPVDANIDIDYLPLEREETTVIVRASTNKTSTGSKTNNGVTLTGKINWTDVTGTNNILKSVSGTCSGAVEYSEYKYGTGPYFLHETWHSETFSNVFNDNLNSGRTANSFVLEITAKPVGKSKFVLRVSSKLTD